MLVHCVLELLIQNIQLKGFLWFLSLIYIPVGINVLFAE